MVIFDKSTDYSKILTSKLCDLTPSELVNYVLHVCPAKPEEYVKHLNSTHEIGDILAEVTLRMLEGINP